jgi:hypothetical protein
LFSSYGTPRFSANFSRFFSPAFFSPPFPFDAPIGDTGIPASWRTSSKDSSKRIGAAETATDSQPKHRYNEAMINWERLILTPPAAQRKPRLLPDEIMGKIGRKCPP